MHIFSKHQANNKSHLSFRNKISDVVNPTTPLNPDISATNLINQEMSTVECSSGRTYNTTIDKSINLQGYISQAKTHNRITIKQAGMEIKANNSDVYQDTYFIFKKALIEKYTKILQESKSHTNVEAHLYQKYFDLNSIYYERNLNDIERRIAYQYELQLYKTGKISCVKYQDSLFRGITVDRTVVDADKNEFNKQMVHAQIHNILNANGINLPKDAFCTLTVDPYSYYIAVKEYSNPLKKQMETALNKGENGKNLYQHIRTCMLQEDIDQTQVTQNGYLKYQAYHQILNYTGLKLNELEEKNGAYYTLDGTDVYDIMSQAINNSMTIPVNFKKQLKIWINHLISELSLKGWNNIPDMTLNLCYRMQETKNE